MSLKIDISEQNNLYKKQNKLENISFVFALGLIILIFIMGDYFKNNGTITTNEVDWVTGLALFVVGFWSISYCMFIMDYFFSIEKALANHNYRINNQNQIEHNGKQYQLDKMNVNNERLELFFHEC